MSENNENRENNREETRERRRTHDRREERPSCGERISAWWGRKSTGEKILDGVLLAGGLFGIYKGANAYLHRDDDDDDEDDDIDYDD